MRYSSLVFQMWTAGRALDAFKLLGRCSSASAFQGITIPKSYHHRLVKHFASSSDVDAKQIREVLGESQTIHETLVASVALMEENSAPEPTSSACHLLSFALKDDFKWEDNGFAQLLDIYENKNYNKDLSDKIITPEERDFYIKMLERRITKEPLQYIIGQWDFHRIVLKVRSPCLCPRPETEELVEFVCDDVRNMLTTLRSKGDSRRVRVLDVGCGTGAIGLSLVKTFPNDIDVFSIDVSPDAISLSKENSIFVLGEDQTQYHDPLLSSAADYTNQNDRSDDRKLDFKYDIIVSNPPYIPSKDMDTLTNDVVDFEDHRALCGGEDGLDVVKDILSRCQEWCMREKPRDVIPICWMEVDDSHPILIDEYLELDERVDFDKGVHDFRGLPRFVRLKVKV
jgi:release factor glutamine methyltransferase